MDLRRSLAALAIAVSMTSSAQAAQILSAKVASAQAKVWSSDGGKMTPVQTLPQGSALQISDQQKSGWRQVVIREPGKPARWGWIAERDIQVAGTPAAAPTSGVAQSREAQAPTPDRAADTKKNESVTLGFKAGYGLLFPTTTGFPPGLFTPGFDLGFRLLGNRSGALFLELHTLGYWYSASTGDINTDGATVFLISGTSMAYLTGRNLFHTGFYAGAGAGVNLAVGVASITLSSTNTTTNITQLSFAFGAQVGYDIRPVPIFSFGPEIQYIGVVGSSGMSSTIAFLGTLRFHF